MEKEKQREINVPTQKIHPVSLYVTQNKIPFITEKKLEIAKAQYNYLKHAFDNLFKSIEIVDFSAPTEEVDKRKIIAVFKITFSAVDVTMIAYRYGIKIDGIRVSVEWKVIILTNELLGKEELIESKDVSVELMEDYQITEHTIIRRRDYKYMYFIRFPAKLPFMNDFFCKFRQMYL